MNPQSARASRAAAALVDAEPACWWLDDDDRPEPAPPLTGTRRCDLAVVGGGYSGLWTALLAKQRGAYRGRKKSLNSEQIAELKRRVAAGDQKTLVARDFGISRETLYQYLRED